MSQYTKSGEEFVFENLIDIKGVKHDDIFFIIMFFENGVSVLGVSKDFGQEEINDLILRFKGDNTPWPEYNRDGDLVYSFRSRKSLIIKAKDLANLEMLDCQKFLEGFIKEENEKRDSVYQVW